MALVLSRPALWSASAAHELHPHARRVLLVARGAWKEEHPAVAAMRSGQADSYVFVPWGLRERWLYLPVTESLADWEASQKPTFEALRVVGEDWDPRTHELRDVLSRAGLPVGYYRPDRGGASSPRTVSTGAPRRCSSSGVVGRGRSSLERIVTALGFATEPERSAARRHRRRRRRSAAAVYAASEGQATVVIEASVPGGQAGTSSRIRNYLGFPNGVSGRDLASRALEQAWFFGARLVLQGRHRHPCGRRPPVVELAGGHEIAAASVVVATGANWNRLGVPALEALRGAGVSTAPPRRTRRRRRRGRVRRRCGELGRQAAVHLARSGASVTLVVRGERLAATMSDYLVSEIAGTPGIDVRLRTEIVGGGGGNRLTSLVLRDDASGRVEEVAADALHVLIGAVPETGWLAGVVARDGHGSILTGADVTAQKDHPWPLERPPLLLETSLPGVFAAGDVRRGSVKRVASAVGAGGIAVQLVHLRLAELAAQRRWRSPGRPVDLVHGPEAVTHRRADRRQPRAGGRADRRSTARLERAIGDQDRAPASRSAGPARCPHREAPQAPAH